MPEKKRGKIKLQITFSAIMLAVIFIVELYAMINMPKMFVVIGLLGIFSLVCLYILISGIFAVSEMKKEREEEQYDSIFKSEKASYLMLRKYFEEIEEKLLQIEKTSKVPTEEIVGTQKGIGKVIINRSRENADAIINSNDQVLESIAELEEMLQGNNAQLISAYKESEDDVVQQLLMKQQDMIMNLKDMELRLNNAIMQSQKVIAASVPVVAAPTVQTVPIAEPIVTAPEPVVEPEPAVAAPAEEEKPPMPDLSDPNKMMSPDDIAALFAAMG